MSLRTACFPRVSSKAESHNHLAILAVNHPGCRSIPGAAGDLGRPRRAEKGKPEEDPMKQRPASLIGIGTGVNMSFFG